MRLEITVIMAACVYTAVYLTTTLGEISEKLETIITLLEAAG